MDYVISTPLWSILIAFDFLISIKLFLMYKKDSDIRKIMFITGLLACVPIYLVAIIGTNSSQLAENILNWSPLPILLAFILALLCNRLNLDSKKCFKYFILGFIFFLALVLCPVSINSPPFLLAGFIFAVSLSLLQLLNKFDISSAIIFISMPSFAVCLLALEQNMTELALFAGFAAKASLILGFKASETLSENNFSFFALKKKLDVAEKNFNQLFTLLPDFAIILDPKGNLLAISPNLIELSGFEKEELVSMNFFKANFLTDKSKTIASKNFTKRMLGFKVAPYQIELNFKDKTQRTFELNATKIEFAGTTADLAILRDLSERNKLVESVAMEKERFLNIAESTGDWIWEVDTEGKYSYSNQVVEKISGYNADEIIEMNYFDLVSTIEQAKTKELFDYYKSKKESFSFIKKCLHKDGKISLLESHVALKTDSKGNFIGFRGVDRDITERKIAEEQLTNTKNYLETVLNSVLSGIVIIDEETNEILGTNQAALKIIGAKKEDIIGKACYKYFCPSDVKKCPITDYNLDADKTEMGLFRSDGSKVSLLKNVTRTEFNGKSLLLESFIDISERKQMEERMLNSERLAGIGELATMVAHDLRNPLQGIATALHYVKRATRDATDRKIANVLQHAEDSVKYSDKIIRDLLDYSAKIKLEIRETNPCQLIGEVLSRINVPAKIQIINEVKTEPKVYLDIDRIGLVILHIITNAIDAMPDGGTLTINSRETLGELELFFKDTGIGIKEMNKLYTPFFTTKAKGMGLGLSICRRTIEEHGGRILIESESGKGTTITVVLPMITPEKNTVELNVDQLTIEEIK